MRNDKGYGMYGMGRILNGLKRRLRDVSKLKGAWRPGFLWLYRNRYLRMDANVDINDKRRRLFHLDRYEFATGYLKNMHLKNPVILDAACGTGYGSDVLKKVNPKQIVGLDISSDAISYASKKYGNERCTFKVCDILKMSDINDCLFDAAVSFETIEHIDNPIGFLTNLSRVLKKDGVLVISTPNRWGLTKDHKFDYNYELLKEHLERFFKIESIYIQNSGCMELWTNRGSPRRLVKAEPENIEQAECFIAIAKNTNCYRNGKKC